MTQATQTEAQRLPEIKDMLNAPQVLNNNDRAFWVLGWNECRDAAKPLIARIAELEAQLEAIGAGGVEPLRKPVQQKAQPVAWLAEHIDRDGNAAWYVSTHKDLAEENDMHGEPKPLYTHPTPQGLEADMFWDAEDPERCESSINNVVVEVDNYRGLKVGDIVTIQRAARLPDLEVRVTQVPDAEGNGDLEWDVAGATTTEKEGE